MCKLALSCRTAVLLTIAFCFCGSGSTQERTASVLDAAREELQAARLSQKEIHLRLKIVENVATVKAYYPHADGGLPETRNSKYWKPNRDGSYVPRGKPTEAIRDLWRTESGIRCTKLSTLVMIKAMIDVADEKRLADLDDMLRGKVIPNDLPEHGIGTLFNEPDPAKGEIYQVAELLPGDQVWFENPYFRRLSRKQQRTYIGQEGHHVFYIGAGKVMDMYTRVPVAIDRFRETFLRWKSVRLVAEQEESTPRAADFQIKAVRRVIFDAQ